MMERFKKYVAFDAGVVVTLAGVIMAILTYEGGNYKNTKYGYALMLAFAGIVILAAGAHTAFSKEEQKSRVQVSTLAQAALCAALSYIGCTYLKIQVPVPGTEGTMFHLGNVFCVLAALLLGGFWGGLSGAVGMSIGDLLSGVYVTTAPKTFVLKLCIGLIVGLVAHKGFKLSKPHKAGYVTVATIVSAIAGMAFNVVADPVVGYFYKMYLYGIPQDLAATLAKVSSITTSVNAVIAVIVASIVYLALRPVMKKAGLLKEIG
jgi:uncharacterized membrane protein